MDNEPTVFCINCGKKILKTDLFCPYCGAKQDTSTESVAQVEDNNDTSSTEGSLNENGNQVPREIKGWNWGAFMFNIFWGIGNNSYLPLLCLIPIFNIFWIFVVGFKGNEWAWQNGNYKDAATFIAVQKTWNRAGLVQFILAIAGFILYILFFASIASSLMYGF